MIDTAILLANNEVATVGTSAAEKILFAVGIVMTLVLIVVFVWIIRMAMNDSEGGEGDTREKL